MFEELFAPGRKHTNDERKRLELSRVDLNDGDPGRGPIDLTSGKVVVRLPKQERDQEQEEGQDATGRNPCRNRTSPEAGRLLHLQLQNPVVALPGAAAAVRLARHEPELVAARRDHRAQ